MMLLKSLFYQTGFNIASFKLKKLAKLQYLQPLLFEVHTF